MKLSLSCQRRWFRPPAEQVGGHDLHAVVIGGRVTLASGSSAAIIAAWCPGLGSQILGVLEDGGLLDAVVVDHLGGGVPGRSQREAVLDGRAVARHPGGCDAPGDAIERRRTPARVRPPP